MIMQCDNCGNYVEGQMVRSFGHKMTNAAIKKGVAVSIIDSFVPGIVRLAAGVFRDKPIKEATDSMFEGDSTKYEFRCPKCGHSWITSKAFEEELKELEEEGYFQDDEDDYYSDSYDSDVTFETYEGYGPLPTDPTPTSNFYMVVEDAFTVTNVGTVVTGRIDTGFVFKDGLLYLKQWNRIVMVKVLGIEMFRKILDRAEHGDNVGILIKGVRSEDVSQGDKLMSLDQLSTKERNWITRADY